MKRKAYFDCTVAPGGNSVAHAPSELPSCALLASPARPRWPSADPGAGWRRSSVGSSRYRIGHHQTR